MPFMKKYITEQCYWIMIETSLGDFFVPEEEVSNAVSDWCDVVEEEQYLPDEVSNTVKCDLLDFTDVLDTKEIYSVQREVGYGARLSAPGYLDCTEWSVFDTEQEAREYLDELTEYDEDEDEEV
jgi:hypothetical protein